MNSATYRRFSGDMTGSKSTSYFFPGNSYLFEVNKGNTRKRCGICSKLTIKTPERRQLRRSGDIIVNFEHISHLFLVLLFLNWNK